MTREPRKYKLLGNLRPQDLKPLGIGLELSAVIGGFSYGGYWLDQKWGTEPMMLLIGVAIGTLGGGWHAIKMANGGKIPDLGLKPKKPKPDDSDNQPSDKKPKP